MWIRMLCSGSVCAGVLEFGADTMRKPSRRNMSPSRAITNGAISSRHSSMRRAHSGCISGFRMRSHAPLVSMLRAMSPGVASSCTLLPSGLTRSTLPELCSTRCDGR
jgi:hypothetical protein